MATFILVHGAFHGGWCWEKIVGRLRASNHVVVAPDLPGVGKNWLPPQDVTLAVTGGFIADLARLQSERAVLVAHSLGGITISDAAERAPEAIMGLVFAAAMLLPSGSAAGEVYQSAPLPEGLTVSDDGLSITDDPSHARDRYYNGCEEADIQRAIARLSPQPMRMLGDRLRLSEERFGRLPRAYVECLDDHAMPLELQRLQQRALPCDPVYTMNSGHSPYFEAPDLFADHLIDAAKIFDNRPSYSWRD